MIEREDIDHNIFVLRLIIRSKFGVEGENLDQAMSQIKRRLPRRTLRAASKISHIDQLDTNEDGFKPVERNEFDELVSGFVDDLVYYGPDEVRSRKMSGGRWEAIVQLGIAATLLAFFLQWQGLI